MREHTGPMNAFTDSKGKTGGDEDPIEKDTFRTRFKLFLYFGFLECV